MKVSELQSMAKDTCKIANKNFYNVNGKTININAEGKVKFYSLEDIQYIKNEHNKCFDKSSDESNYCKIRVIKSDTYEAAKSLDNPLVLNFANAHYPGGGFLDGCRAQEEELCRRSNLYNTLLNKEANKMYKYNNTNISPYDSDCMILSENVCVFRDLNYQLLLQPYYVTVITCPAINLYTSRGVIDNNKISSIMINRIESILCVAAKNGYRNLVLGAWGCGAFGHDANDVASYFRWDIDQRLYECFDEIVFAINDEGYNLEAFKSTFEDYQIM